MNCKTCQCEESRHSPAYWNCDDCGNVDCEIELPQWTPIEKGLPTENDMYLVTAMDILVNRLVVYTNSFLDGEFRDTFGFEIIAWMALPKAYQAEKEEKK